LFHQLTMQGYPAFDLTEMAPVVAAARVLLRDLPAAFDAFVRDFGLLSG